MLHAIDWEFPALPRVENDQDMPLVHLKQSIVKLRNSSAIQPLPLALSPCMVLWNVSKISYLKISN